MSSSIATIDVPREPAARDPVESPASTRLRAPAMNTILAVREHAPAEIDELDALMETLELRLTAAGARRQLLVRMLAVINEAAPVATGAQGVSVPFVAQAPQPMALVR